MTHQLETRFRCNRCQVEEFVPHHTTPSAGPKPPDGWMVLIIDQVYHHLCGDCTVDFQKFLQHQR